MIYSVYLDGESIYENDFTNTLLSPTCDLELNAAGSFKFTMPPGHIHYNSPKLLMSNVEVLELDESDKTKSSRFNSIFYGRVIKISTDSFNQKIVECEGALAFFNDSIQRPNEFEEFSNREFFRYLIRNHNEQVAEDRKFVVRKIDIPEKPVYRKLDYQSTLNCLQEMCLNAEGGYFVIEKVNGLLYIDWLEDMPYVSNQSATFGLNITDISQILDGMDVKTSVIPVGQAGEDGKRPTCSESNNGLDYIDTNLIKKYGRITQVLEFQNITRPNDLVTAAKKWIKDYQFDPISIEVNVAELSYLNKDYTPYIVGQKVHVTSTPHLIDKYLSIVKLSLNLDEPMKKVTMGTIKKRDLTEITKNSY